MPIPSLLSSSSLAPEMVSKSKQVITFRTLEQAISFFDALSPFDEVEVFISGIPPDTPESEDHYRVWVRPDGRVQFFGLPTSAHEVVGGTFTILLAFELGKIGIDPTKVASIGASTRVFTRPGLKEPDFFFRPLALKCPPEEASDSAGNAYPTLVLETAYLHESQISQILKLLPLFFNKNKFL